MMYLSLQKIQVNNGQSVPFSIQAVQTNQTKYIHSISTPIWGINSFFTTKASCSQIDRFQTRDTKSKVMRVIHGSYESLRTCTCSGNT